MAYKIDTVEGLERKAKFEQLVKNAGFENVFQLCKETGINMANLYSNLGGTYKMSIGRMFTIANALGVPIGQILALFYPKEYEENMKLL